MEEASFQCPQGPQRMTGQLQASGPLCAVFLSSVGHSVSWVPLDGRAGGRWPIEGVGTARPIYGGGLPPSDGAKIDG